MLSAAGAANALPAASYAAAKKGSSKPGNIPNEYALYLPGEQEALRKPPQVAEVVSGGVVVVHGGTKQRLSAGEHVGGWVLNAVVEMNGVLTAVFERHVSHRGAIAYVTQRGGTIALIPTGIGDLANIRPRPVNTRGGVKLERPLRMVPGPDAAGDFLLGSSEDPCYENVAALGPEHIGWTLVSSDGAGPMRSVYLQPDGVSREPKPSSQETWAPDMEGALFDPADYFPFQAPEQYA